MTNVAVVGSGHWGAQLVRNFAELGALAWICDADEGLLAKHASNHPGVRVTPRIDEVLSDAGVDAVVVSTPAEMHAPMAKAVLAAGKDVFVEKPLALRYKEGQEIAGLADGRGAILMVGHLLEYHPAVVKLREIVASGDLGRVRYVYSNRLNLGRVRQRENILWSFAPHDISVLSGLLGAEPLSVSTAGGAYLQDDIADVTVTNLAFAEGVRAHIFVSWLHPHKEAKLVVIGDRKMAVFDDLSEEGKLTVLDKGIDWKEGLPVARETEGEPIPVGDEEPLRAECRHFLECVEQRRRPLTDADNGLSVLKVLEASQMSLDRGGEPVFLTEVESALPV
ncbi:MAG: Gfo/Idh/MocA family oxidoreductase [Actinomycetota bacterium]